MDSLSEEKIMDNLKLLPIDSVILVSHRLSTITACDLVYFLKAQDTVTIDNPASLIENDKEFHALLAAQIYEMPLHEITSENHLNQRLT